MGYVVYMDRLAFQPVDAQGIPTGKEEIVYKGGAVPDYVPPFTINALSNAGMIVDVGDRSDPRRAALAAQQVPPPALPNPEQPVGARGEVPLLNLDVTGQPVADTIAEAQRDAVTGEARHDTTATEGVAPSEVPAPAPKPGMRDSKQAWEDYAVSIGMDRGEAESTTKAELIAAVEAREAVS